MERDGVSLPLGIGELESLRTLSRKTYCLKWNRDDSVLGPVVIAQLKIAFGELGVPADAIEQFVNRSHLVSRMAETNSFAL